MNDIRVSYMLLPKCKLSVLNELGSGLNDVLVVAYIHKITAM